MGKFSSLFSFGCSHRDEKKNQEEDRSGQMSFGIIKDWEPNRDCVFKARVCYGNERNKKYKREGKLRLVCLGPKLRPYYMRVYLTGCRLTRFVGSRRNIITGRAAEDLQSRGSFFEKILNFCRLNLGCEFVPYKSSILPMAICSLEVVKMLMKSWK